MKVRIFAIILVVLAGLGVFLAVIKVNDDKQDQFDSYIELARKKPEVTFIFYIPPYSYCYWDAMVRTGQLQYVLDVEEYAVSLLLEEENIKIYAFDDMTDVTTDLDNYTDTLHYVSEVCNIIAEKIYKDEGNVASYYDQIDKVILRLKDEYLKMVTD